eukprot:TRINITY_DN12778_c0_g1_i1.p2 TRINITY_DN12778_c0_g1~~TRINITY_DN12778_c0_g1_i1.p2  ORF type:complete len:228 (+),score=26.22 TRINITY_DN12778_c0_g1_i1:102-785(+)
MTPQKVDLPRFLCCTPGGLDEELQSGDGPLFGDKVISLMLESGGANAAALQYAISLRRAEQHKTRPTAGICNQTQQQQVGDDHWFQLMRMPQPPNVPLSESGLEWSLDFGTATPTPSGGTCPQTTTSNNKDAMHRGDSRSSDSKSNTRQQDILVAVRGSTPSPFTPCSIRTPRLPSGRSAACSSPAVSSRQAQQQQAEGSDMAAVLRGRLALDRRAHRKRGTGCILC